MKEENIMEVPYCMLDQAMYNQHVICLGGMNSYAIANRFIYLLWKVELV